MSQPKTFIAIALCFLLSGFAALLYQIAWLRQFSIVFGTSEIAVAMILAAYMGGLAAGSAVIGRFLHRINRPILTYGILEGGIAVAALSVPLLLAAANVAFIYLFGGQTQPPGSDSVWQSLFYPTAVFLLIGLPTACMGATLPLLTKFAVRSDDELGPRVAVLYGTNTAGAVLGAVAGGFLILPSLGMTGTVWTGVAINLIVFAIAWQLDRSVQSTAASVERSARSSAEAKSISFVDPQTWMLPVMAVSGAIAFTYEVLWTRLLNHVLGGSLYAFATMLASFLAGIAIGSGLAGVIAKDRQRSAVYFAASQVLIATASMLVFSWIDDMIPDANGMAANAVFAAVVLLPSTVFIGATFPLAVRIVAGGQHDAGVATARIYVWNTVGAISGAIFAGFHIIPALGFAGTVRFATVGNFTLAVVVACLLSQRKLAYGAVTAAGLVATVIVFDPKTPAAVIHSSALSTAEQQEERDLFFAVGRSSTVLLVEKDGAFDLRTNGLPEARVFASGSPPVRNVQSWLSALAVIARPDARSMCVIGLGAGVAIEGIPPSVTDVDVIELEQEVVNANRIIADARETDPLAMSRIRVIINDARNALSLTSKKYDSIVSQPSHPWTSGASHLYTREFLEIAKRRLNPDGVFIQWMNSRFVDDSLLRSLAATMTAVYGHVQLYQADPGVLFFIGSDSPLNIERRLIHTGGKPISEYKLHFSRLGINAAEDVLLALALDEAGTARFSGSAGPVTDDDNRMATRSKILGNGLSAEELSDLLAPYDPLLNIDSWVFQELESIDVAYLASSMIRLQFTKRAARLRDVLPDRATPLLIDAMILRHRGEESQALDRYVSAYRAKPSDVAIQYHLVSQYLAELARGKAQGEIAAIAAGLEGPPGAVIRGWQYGLESNWRALAELDAMLARAVPTEPWYSDAVLLRAEWRTKVVVHGDNKYARDALSMVDRALLIGPSLDLFVLRGTSAILLGDAGTAFETFRALANYVRELMTRTSKGEYHFSRAALDALIVRLSAFGQELEKPVYSRFGSEKYELQETIDSLLTDARERLEQ